MSALLLLPLVWVACSVSSLAQQGERVAAPDWVTNVIGKGAKKEIIDKFSPKLTRWHQTIAALEAMAVDSAMTSADFQRASDTLSGIRSELSSFVSEISPELNDSKARLEKLGPAPKDDVQEAPDITEQRKSLADEVAAYDGLIKRAELLRIQANQMLASYSATRRSQFVRQILRRSSEFSEGWYWQRAIALFQSQSTDIFQQARRWFQSTFVQNWIGYTSWFLGCLLIAWLARVLLISVLRSSPATISYPVETRAERGAITLRRTFSTAAPVAIALLAAYLVGTSFNLFNGEDALLIGRCFVYFGVAVFLISSAHFALRPNHPSERLVTIDDRSAPKIFYLLSILVVVWLVDQVFTQIDQHLGSPLSVVVLRSGFVAIVIGLLLLGSLLIKILREDATPQSARTNGWPRWLFAAIAFVAVGIMATVGLGYISLGRFIGTQIVTTGGLFVFVTLVHLTAEFVSSPRPKLTETDEEAANRTVLGATLGVTIGLALDLLVLLIGIPLLLLQWGYEWAEVRSWVSSALLGFQIGEIKVSLLSVFISIAILVVGILFTRLLRGMFERRSAYVFTSGSGTRDSIATVLTYAGFVLSLIAAVSYLGFNLSNLALIAGALSVGIGFGLQSVANNFVSGLILLAERPIKVGDWIVVGDREGRVQRISVRSTQIRTFDRSTVIVPNADLITGQVINWDHGDTLGRVMIDVGVAYGTDPRKVIELLTQIGKDHPMTLMSDASPLVAFEGFGDSSMDFSLRVLIYDIKNVIKVRTDLRVAIVEKFNEEKIEIPFPQRDVHLKEG